MFGAQPAIKVVVQQNFRGPNNQIFGDRGIRTCIHHHGLNLVQALLVDPGGGTWAAAPVSASIRGGQHLLRSCDRHLFAAGSLTASRAARLIGAYSTVAWAMLIGFAITIPLVLIAGIPTGLTGTNSIWWAVSGLGNVAGLVFAASAFRLGKVGVVAPILATEGALAATIAAILGESIAPLPPSYSW